MLSVLFVEQTKGGLLAREIRSTVARISPKMGFTLRIVENAGSSLGSIFSNKNPWLGQRCGRSSCNPCSQGEEVVEDCKKQNILYESLCKECNPGKQEPGAPLEDKRVSPSIYVGESARSLFERSI